MQEESALVVCRRALIRLRHVLLPCLITFSLTFGLRVVRLAIASSPLSSASSSAAVSATFEGSHVAIKVWENGRYLEVGDDLWIYASAFTHNKASARFEVEPVSPALLRSLVASREFKPKDGASGGKWDMRPEPGGGSLYADYSSSSETVVPSTTSPPPVGQDPAAAVMKREEEREREATERARVRLAKAAARGAKGWVLLRSPYAAGYVEVLGRGEGDEYVVRVASEGRLSYRSLFMLGEDSVWSHAVGGYLNWRRPTSTEPRQHVRAHGNIEPWGPLRTLVPSARLHVLKPPPLVDVLGAMACPTKAPAFDWNLLLDAARAGSCAAADLSSLRTAASALDALTSALGDGYSAELSDLANGYRQVLLDREWVGVLDLQLRPCFIPADDEAAAAAKGGQLEGAGPGGGGPGDGAARPPRGFSWLEGSELRVDGAQCPRPGYSEVMLRPTPDEPLALEMVEMETVAVGSDGAINWEAAAAEAAAAADAGADAAADAAGTADAAARVAAAGDASGVNASSLAPPGLPPPAQLRAGLLTDAVFVLCEYVDPNSAGGYSEGGYSAGGYSTGGEAPAPSGREEGEEGEVAADQPKPLRQALWFRLSPEVECYGSGCKKAEAESRDESGDKIGVSVSGGSVSGGAVGGGEGTGGSKVDDASLSPGEVAALDEAVAQAEEDEDDPDGTVAAAAAAYASTKEREAKAAARAKSERMSVLLLQLDATSRAHLHRMLPRSLALLRAMAASGGATLYEFPHYSIVGYNSLPNMVPMLSGVDSQTLIDMTPVSQYNGGGGGGGSVEGVWSDFGRRGYATMLMEELHDGDTPSPRALISTCLAFLTHPSSQTLHL